MVQVDHRHHCAHIASFTEVVLRLSLVVLMSDATSPRHRHVQEVSLGRKIDMGYDIRHAPEDPGREVPQRGDDRVTATLPSVCNASSDVELNASGREDESFSIRASRIRNSVGQSELMTAPNL